MSPRTRNFVKISFGLTTILSRWDTQVATKPRSLSPGITGGLTSNQTYENTLMAVYNVKRPKHVKARFTPHYTQMQSLIPHGSISLLILSDRYTNHRAREPSSS